MIGQSIHANQLVKHGHLENRDYDPKLPKDLLENQASGLHVDLIKESKRRKKRKTKDVRCSMLLWRFGKSPSSSVILDVNFFVLSKKSKSWPVHKKKSLGLCCFQSSVLIIYSTNCAVAKGLIVITVAFFDKHIAKAIVHIVVLIASQFVL